MKLQISQIDPTLNKKRNYDFHVKEIKKAISNKVDVVAFPELSLNGYSVQDLAQEDFFSIEDFEELKELSESIDIVLGAIYKSTGGRVFNSAIYMHDKQINIHYKNNLPNYGMFEEKRFFYEGRGFSVFEIENKKVSMAICEDVWSEKNVQYLQALQVDILYILASSPAVGFYKSLDIQKKWYDILDEISSSINKVVFINRVGVEDGISFWGGSRVVCNKNKTTLKLFEKETKVLE